MSSDEQQLSSEEEPTLSAKARGKKRRIQTARACERCRTKKTRCDGKPGDKSCSQCQASDATCVFSDKPKKRRDKAYIESLESRLERLQLLLERLHPGEDFQTELEGKDHVPLPTTGISTAAILGVASNAPSAEDARVRSHDNSSKDSISVALGSPRVLASGDDDEHYFAAHWPPELVEILEANDISANPVSHYYGRSSSAQFFSTAVNIRSELEGTDQDVVNQIVHSTQVRPDFWTAHPWERHHFSSASRQSRFMFPSPQLLRHLVDNYFEECHHVCPVLHRPTFEANLAAENHLTNEGFGTVVLLVCANSSRLSNDPRVLFDHPDKPGHRHSAGWAWYSQVQLIRNGALAAPTLYDLQAIALSVVYVTGTSPARSAWSLIGTGIRMAMDMGIHRRQKVIANKVEGELWKRAFWILVMLDVTNSSFLGRPTAIALDNFDVAFPTAVDDKYWTHPNPAHAFVQPVGEPSYSAYFGCLLKLLMIHSHALRTIYSPDKDRLVAKLGESEWERHVVVELDSALNRWADSIPEYLKWNETTTDKYLLIQSSVLGMTYHHTRITIHRPFVASARNNSISSLPSLTICTSAARSIVHLIQAQRNFSPTKILMVAIIPAFMSGMMLLLRVWVVKRAGMRVNMLNDMKDISFIIHFLDDAETTWPLAGRLKDMVHALATAGDVSLPITLPTKRLRDENETQAEGFSALPISNMPLSAQSEGLSEHGEYEGATGHVLHRVVPSMPHTMSLFGPPLAQRADGLYPFDPAPAGLVAHENSSAGSFPSASPREYNYQTLYHHQPLSSSQLDTGYLSQQPHSSMSSNSTTSFSSTSRPVYSTVPPGDHTQDNYPLYNQPFCLESTDPPLLQPTHIDDSQLMSLLNSSPTQGAPASDMATMWSSLPATLQPEEWMRYMSTMANLSGNTTPP